MASLKDWAALCRPHTAALTMAGTALGAWAGGAAPPELLAWAAWALLFHAVGFLDNGLRDAEHDKRDPSKAHFPLVTGAISREAAAAAWALGMVMTFFTGLLLVVYHDTADRSGAHAIAALLLAMGFGSLYNRTSKRSLLAPLWISASFAFLPAFAFLATAGPPLRGAGAYVAAYGFFMLLHQIAYSGYLKDLGPDPVNLLRRLGARLEPARAHLAAIAAGGGEAPIVPGSYVYSFPPAVRAWGLATRAAAPALAVAWALLEGGADWAALAGILAALALCYWTLSRPGLWARAAKVRIMGACEALAYLALVASLAGSLGGLAPWLYLGPLAWYFGANRVLWGKWATPAV